MGLFPLPSIDFFFANNFFLINYELKTPSVEIACLLGIQNEIQAVCTYMNFVLSSPSQTSRHCIKPMSVKVDYKENLAL